MFGHATLLRDASTLTCTLLNGVRLFSPSHSFLNCPISSQRFPISTFHLILLLLLLLPSSFFLLPSHFRH
ncbi:hypothetical protein L6452_15994 [Arctium lappa]|uniref:Uncharacterized protein n=1 Tax=Arctium lappa TaxID=4217 RepID=A0ACB9CQK2_ARCLA|nr:hypothetical protein L6452_15994 [Arctium lappa]